MSRPILPGPQPQDLLSIRSRIDEVDEDLVTLIAARVDLARRAGAVKAANGLDMVDLAREAAVVRRASGIAREKGLEPETLRDVFWRLIGLSRWAVSHPARSGEPGV